jgi:sec-independent protein translocase protein TatA
MGSFSLTHWLVVLVIVLIVFGAGKLPKVMGDLGKGVRSFKAGLKDDDADGDQEEAAARPPEALAVEQARAAAPAKEGDDAPAPGLRPARTRPGRATPPQAGPDVPLPPRQGGAASAGPATGSP